MEQVPIGSKVNRLGISRVQCAEGSTCRCVLLANDPCMKHVAFDNNIKRAVEVDQDMCLQYGLRPFPTFYYLVAKLNTDLNGDVIGDKFTVEYIQLSENLNNDFATEVKEHGIPKSIALTKVKKTGEGGKDFSYTKATTSSYDPLDGNPSLAKKINDLRSNAEFIAKCWQMIDATTTINKQQYLQLIGQNEQGAKGAVENKPSAARQIESAVHEANSAPANVPGDDLSEVNDFGEGDDDFNFKD